MKIETSLNKAPQHGKIIYKSTIDEKKFRSVTPAKAGVQIKSFMDSRLRGNDKEHDILLIKKIRNNKAFIAQLE